VELGRRFVPALIDWRFEGTETHRLELDCSMENPRALRVYAREGFVQEGVAREIYRTPEGRFVSSAMLSMLRPEWAALPRRAAL
jgi:RimJ/RimL family protein N-acetyltransferase